MWHLVLDEESSEGGAEDAGQGAHLQRCRLERVVVSQNEFCVSALAYFNVFFNFGVGLFSSIFVFGRFLWG